MFRRTVFFIIQLAGSWKVIRSMSSEASRQLIPSGTFSIRPSS